MPTIFRQHTWGYIILASFSIGYYKYIFSGHTKTIVSIGGNGIAIRSEPPSTLLVGYGVIIILFLIAFIRSVRVHWISTKLATQFRKNDRQGALNTTQHQQATPSFTIFVPARNETRVIENTMTRLSLINYNKKLYNVVVITDQREEDCSGLTTTNIARQHALLLNNAIGRDLFHIIAVPDSFDGDLRRANPANSGSRSTKGRALNYGLQWLEQTKRIDKCDYIGVLDADGRLHKEALSNVARITNSRDADIIQGPVFQISNLGKADLVGIMAGIELSLHHISRMWLDLNSKKDFPRFLAGTNYFIKAGLMLETGGWNSESLVEDAELGLHLYLKKQAKALWLPAYEIEQTPPSWTVYLKQRERWALGHLQLIPIISNSGLPLPVKIRIYVKILLHFVESPLDILLPIISWQLIRDIQFYRFGAIALPIMLAMTFISLYTWAYLSRGLALLNPFSATPLPKYKVIPISLLLTFFMPGLAVLQLIPRFKAAAKFFTNYGSADWYKTERSKEYIEEVIANA
jgi:cellulose synthase/poly-beta-1,6-N-acetylglucosamine synthase-like glycosyltransferase